MLLIASITIVINQNRVDNDRHRAPSRLLYIFTQYGYMRDELERTSSLPAPLRFDIRHNHIKCDPFVSKHKFLSYMSFALCLYLYVSYKPWPMSKTFDGVRTDEADIREWSKGIWFGQTRCPWKRVNGQRRRRACSENLRRMTKYNGQQQRLRDHTCVFSPHHHHWSTGRVSCCV